MELPSAEQCEAVARAAKQTISSGHANQQPATAIWVDWSAEQRIPRASRDDDGPRYVVSASVEGELPHSGGFRQRIANELVPQLGGILGVDCVQDRVRYALQPGERFEFDRIMGGKDVVELSQNEGNGGQMEPISQAKGELHAPQSGVWLMVVGSSGCSPCKAVLEELAQFQAHFERAGSSSGRSAENGGDASLWPDLCLVSKDASLDGATEFCVSARAILGPEFPLARFFWAKPIEEDGESSDDADGTDDAKHAWPPSFVPHPLFHELGVASVPALFVMERSPGEHKQPILRLRARRCNALFWDRVQRVLFELQTETLQTVSENAGMAGEPDELFPRSPLPGDEDWVSRSPQERASTMERLRLVAQENPGFVALEQLRCRINPGTKPHTSYMTGLRVQGTIRAHSKSALQAAIQGVPGCSGRVSVKQGGE